MRRSLMLVGPRRLQWQEEPLVPLGSGEVMVETVAGAISVGSELPLYRGEERSARRTTYPRMTGYESLGIVRELGPGVSQLMLGDRVVATYGHRTAAVIPQHKAILVAAGVGDELALLSILSCDVARGVDKLRPGADERVVITGAGTMGLLTLWTLRARGLRRVDVVEPLAGRRDHAAALGARAVLAPEELRTGEVYDAGVECSSRDAAFAAMQRAMRHEGRICVLADGNSEPLTLAPEFHDRELSVVGSSDGLDYQAHARWFFERARPDSPPLARLFDCHIAAAELPDTFEQLATGELGAIKVLVRY